MLKPVFYLKVLMSHFFTCFYNILEVKMVGWKITQMEWGDSSFIHIFESLSLKNLGRLLCFYFRSWVFPSRTWVVLSFCAYDIWDWLLYCFSIVMSSLRFYYLHWETSSLWLTNLFVVIDKFLRCELFLSEQEFIHPCSLQV